MARACAAFFVDESTNLAASLDGGHRLWANALSLGCDELNVATPMETRVDRLLLRAHIVRRCSPLLNVIESTAQRVENAGRRAAGGPAPGLSCHRNVRRDFFPSLRDDIIRS